LFTLITIASFRHRCAYTFDIRIALFDKRASHPLQLRSHSLRSPFPSPPLCVPLRCLFDTHTLSVAFINRAGPRIFGGISELFSIAGIITKWALDDAPWGQRGDTIYPSRTLMLLRGPVAASASTRGCFSPRSPACARARARVHACACMTRPRRSLHVIFFGRRHVRANIAAYAYLYGIKNHPSLKMHRPLHSRGVGSSQRDAEA